MTPENPKGPKITKEFSELPPYLQESIRESIEGGGHRWRCYKDDPSAAPVSRTFAFLRFVNGMSKDQVSRKARLPYEQVWDIENSSPNATLGSLTAAFAAINFKFVAVDCSDSRSTSVRYIEDIGFAITMKMQVLDFDVEKLAHVAGVDKGIIEIAMDEYAELKLKHLEKIFPPLELLCTVVPILEAS